MTDIEQRESARQFYNKWRGKGNEDQDGRSYWLDILINILGVENATDRVEFEKKVKVEGDTKKIDLYIPETKTIIEQKSLGKDLDKPILQSGGVYLTPYQQAKRYNDNLPLDEKAKWIVTSNFAEIWIYDMNTVEPEKNITTIQLDEIQGKYALLDFLVNKEVKEISHEMEISIQAGELVGVLYESLLKQYDNPTEEELKSLNMLCVRLVFCFYAEDSGVFGKHLMFHDYLQDFDAKHTRKALIDLFEILDTKNEDRDKYLEPELAQFPYVNGGLFADKSVIIPPITDEIRTLILDKSSADFDWSQISPTIFGAVFESTLNPETRRKGGMHYTSIENIHKVIDPLLLNDLYDEFNDIKNLKQVNVIKQKLEAFCEKLGSLKFLDPACGSGNFLTETYVSLRKLENKALELILEDQTTFTDFEKIKVTIDQFYGIEINDFAVNVAKTALWIAESQMIKATEAIIAREIDFLPLTTNAFIVEGNALRMDWESVVPKSELDFIMGNPPFVGSARLSEKQKEERNIIFEGNGGELDYVSCWYKKATEFIEDYCIRCAFVSTNSICQGQQVKPLWEPLFEMGVHIDFAYRTFIWDSDATIKAHVYCVIIGFSKMNLKKKYIIDNNSNCIEVENINGYLTDAPNVFISKSRTPICDVPIVIKGFQPTDNGYLILSDKEKNEIISKDIGADKWIRQFITAKEYLHGKNRWCLWLKGISPAELNRLNSIKNRVAMCKEWRENQISTGDAYKLKDIPTLMRPSKKFEESTFIVLPRHTGEKRKYVPFGFADNGAIPGDSVSVIINASLYHFGVVNSNVHMAWMRAVCGRLKGDYRYTSDIVYNNFPWCNSTEEQKAKIEQTAQAILDARALYPDCSLADLYDELTMPIELRKAHQANDKAVMQAYGFSTKISESDCVAELMKMYKELVSRNEK